MVYLNDLIDDLTTNVKLFAGDFLLFSVVYNTSTIFLNNDLNKIRKLVIQWKINFNPDPSKQAQEVIFSKKHQKTTHNRVYFDLNSV